MRHKTLLKTLSYAIMHMTFAILVARVLTGSWKVAFAIGLVEPCVQTVAFFFHEKVWHKIDTKHDDHNAVTDSVSPVAKIIDKIFLHKH